jgi:methyltransferase-like protein/SAM-dependent methyltransferase
MSNDPVTMNPYDLVPYISVPIPPSHPDRISVVARLFGMTPPNPQEARVLELGCASGGNLLPMAETLPGSTFVGIDLSQRQILAGQEMLRAAGLKNVTLEQKSVLDFRADAGPFDYVIAHGLYSWVTNDVQQKILELCHDLLSPGGIAYISYNTFPGWHVQGMLRDLLKYRTRCVSDPQLRVRRSRELLDRLSEVFRKGNNVYAAMLNVHVDALRKLHDAFLLHDHLETHNEPLFFHEFNTRAEAVGLQFLGEANFSDMYTGGMSPEAFQTLNSLADDVIELEQYIDFFCNRTLRRTLLCRQGIAIDRRLTSDRAERIYYAADIRPENPQPDIASRNPESFISPAGHNVTTLEPVMKAALVHLARIWPKSIVFEELLEICSRQLNELGRVADAAASDSQILGDGLLHGAAGGLIDLRSNWPPFTTEVGSQPTISPLARAQIGASNIIANRRHEPVKVNDFERFLLVRADGTQTIDDLVRSVVAGVRDGSLRMSINDQNAIRGSNIESLIRQSVTTSLAGTARSSLLIG